MSRAIGPNSQHGVATYNAGCGCDDCRAAKAAYDRRYRRKKNLAHPQQFVCRLCPCSFATFNAVRVHESVIHDL